MAKEKLRPKTKTSKIDVKTEEHSHEHEFWQFLLVGISGNQVKFRIECSYADKNFDDRYSGYVTALVVAEVE